MSIRTVTNKDELKKAKDDNVDTIIIIGQFAEDFKKASTITSISGGAVTAIIAAVGLAPVTGGLSAAVAAPLVAMTGLEIAVIVLAASIGVGIIIAINKGYNVTVEYNDDGLIKKVELTKK